MGVTVTDVPTTAPTFTTRQACQLALVSYRQADHWDRVQVLSPSYGATGSGSRRRYTAREVQALWVLGEMGPDHALATAVLHADDLDGWLVATRGGVTIVRSLREVTDLLAAFHGPVRVLDLRGRPLVNTPSLSLTT